MSGFTVIIHYGSIIVYSYVEFEFEKSAQDFLKIQIGTMTSIMAVSQGSGRRIGPQRFWGSNSGLISVEALNLRDCYKGLGSRNLKTDLESPRYLVIMRDILTYTNAQGEKDVLKNGLILD